MQLAHDGERSYQNKDKIMKSVFPIGTTIYKTASPMGFEIQTSGK